MRIYIHIYMHSISQTCRDPSITAITVMINKLDK